MIKTIQSKLAPSVATSTFQIVQRVISEVTGNNLEDITLDADLENDLGIDMRTEFLAIITRIQRSIDVVLPISDVKNCLTVAELVELVEEEREL